MATTSAGILLYRNPGALEVWLAHMGGPYWAKKDERAWSIPKGLYAGNEPPLDAALREFQEEVGVPAPKADYWHLGEFRQSSGKIITVFAGESDFGVQLVESNTFELEWPPRSGRIQLFPEIDDARWFPIEVARSKAVAGQLAMLDALERSAS